MDDLLETSSDDSEVRALRAEFDQVVSAVRVGLSGLLVVTLSIGVVIYRNDNQLSRQLQVQARMLAEAEKRNQEILMVVAEFQKFAATHPGYATNVLARFNLPALPPTGAPAAAKK